MCTLATQSRDSHMTVVPPTPTDLIPQKLYAAGGVCNENEILDADCSVDVDLGINEGHTH